jgi:hypothetical protein
MLALLLHVLGQNPTYVYHPSISDSNVRNCDYINEHVALCSGNTTTIKISGISYPLENKISGTEYDSINLINSSDVSEWELDTSGISRLMIEDGSVEAQLNAHYVDTDSKPGHPTLQSDYYHNNSIPENCTGWSKLYTNQVGPVPPSPFVNRLWLVCFSGVNDDSLSIYHQIQGGYEWETVYEEPNANEVITKNTDDPHVKITYGTFQLRQFHTADNTIESAEAIDDNFIIKWRLRLHGSADLLHPEGGFGGDFGRDFDVDTLLRIRVNSTGDINVWMYDDLWSGRTSETLGICDKSSQESTFVSITNCESNYTFDGDNGCGDKTNDYLERFAYDSGFESLSASEKICSVSKRRMITAYLFLFDREILKQSKNNEPALLQVYDLANENPNALNPAGNSVIINYYNDEYVGHISFALLIETAEVWFSIMRTGFNVQRNLLTTYQDVYFMELYSDSFQIYYYTSSFTPTNEMLSSRNKEGEVLIEDIFASQVFDGWYHRTIQYFRKNRIAIIMLGNSKKTDNDDYDKTNAQFTVNNTEYSLFEDGFRGDENSIQQMKVWSSKKENEILFVLNTETKVILSDEFVSGYTPIFSYLQVEYFDNEIHQNRAHFGITGSDLIRQPAFEIQVMILRESINKRTDFSFIPNYRVWNNIAIYRALDTNCRRIILPSILNELFNGVTYTFTTVCENGKYTFTVSEISEALLFQAYIRRSSVLYGISTSIDYSFQYPSNDLVVRNALTSEYANEGTQYISKTFIEKQDGIQIKHDTIEFDAALDSILAIRVEEIHATVNGVPVQARLEVVEDGFEFGIYQTRETVAYTAPSDVLWNVDGITLFEKDNGIFVASVQLKNFFENTDGSFSDYSLLLTTLSYENGVLGTPTELEIEDEFYFKDTLLSDSLIEKMLGVSYTVFQEETIDVYGNYRLQCVGDNCWILVGGFYLDKRLHDDYGMLGINPNRLNSTDVENNYWRHTNTTINLELKTTTWQGWEKVLFENGLYSDDTRYYNGPRGLYVKGNSVVNSSVCYMDNTRSTANYENSSCAIITYNIIQTTPPLHDYTVSATIINENSFEHGPDMQHNIGKFEECTQLYMDQEGAHFTSFSCRNGSTWHAFGFGVGSIPHSLDTLLENASSTYVYNNVLHLSSSSDSIIVSLRLDSVQVPVNLDPSQAYTFSFPHGKTLSLSFTSTPVTSGMTPGYNQLLDFLNDKSRVPVHSQQEINMLLFDKNNIETYYPCFEHVALDRSDVTLFFFNESGVFTSLLTDSNNNGVETIFSSFFNHNNVEWYRFEGTNTSCPGDEEYQSPISLEDLEIAVPFYTNESVSLDCNDTARPITPTRDFVRRLSFFRVELDVQFSTDILCVGGSSVQIPGRCNTPETQRNAQTPCSGNDQYVCTVGDDIFNFGTKTESIETNCVSQGGYCLIHDSYTSTVFPGHTHAECEDQCVSDPDCFSFEHGDQNCTTFEFLSTPRELRMKECPENTLGYQCRTTLLELIKSVVVFNPGDEFPFRTEIYKNNTLDTTLIHGKDGSENSRIMHTGSGEKSEFKLEFFPSGNVTGGTVIFGCG